MSGWPRLATPPVVTRADWDRLAEGCAEVALSPSEIRRAAIVGVDRNVAVLDKLHRGGMRGGAQAWQNHINGACGELVVARHLGLIWTESVNTFKREPDLPEFRVEVRTSTEPRNCLIVRPGDVLDRWYVQVTGPRTADPNRNRTFYLRGFAWGAHVVRDGTRNAGYNGRGPFCHLEFEQLRTDWDVFSARIGAPA